MTRYRRSSWISLAVMLGLVASTPFLFGQGCDPRPYIPLPYTGGSIPAGWGLPQPSDDVSDNTPPFFEFIRPETNIIRSVGDVVSLVWEFSDPDDNAVATLMLAPNERPIGHEIMIGQPFFEDDDEGYYLLDTRAEGIAPGAYRLLAKINDGVNPERTVVATGMLYLLGPGQAPMNIPPTVVATEPLTSVTLGHDEAFPIEWCVADPDDGGEEGMVTDVIIVLDVDEEAENDLDFNRPDAEQYIEALCRAAAEEGPQAVVVDNKVVSYVLGCAIDGPGGVLGDCDDPALNATPFPPNGLFVMDLDEIEVPVDGSPYHVRVTAWDHINKPVDDYAFGTVHIAGRASGIGGVVDMRQIGQSVSGARFMGFDAGAHVGSTGTTLGDFNGDGADDFLIVARWGRSYERGNLGAAYIVSGKPTEKYGGTIDLNSVGTDYGGAIFAMNKIAGSTEGIVSVTTIDDLTGDGLPEIVFGLPYVEGWYDYFDDDAADCTDLCYGDLMPNPLSSGDCNPNSHNDDLSDYDGGHFVGGSGAALLGSPFVLRESTDCSNDGLEAYVSNDQVLNATRIDQGYAIFVASENDFNNTVIELGFVGMKDPSTLRTDEHLLFGGGAAPTGARFRGGYYVWDEWDDSQTRRPYVIIPDNDYGRTVASMRDLSNGGLIAARDERPELLISAPLAFVDDRGAILVNYGMDWSTFSNQEVQSLPINRGYLFPVFRTMQGERMGDMLGYATGADDFNQDRHVDILCGAPGADRNGRVDSGIVYIIFGRLDFPDFNLAEVSPPRIELHGTRSGDRFGAVQTIVGNVDNDRYPSDIGFASPYAGSDGPGGAESGFIGIVFAGQRITGENVLKVDDVGGPQLRGTRIYGRQAGGHAGAVINGGGDFNGDGREDLIIVAPDETRVVGNITRRGVAYVIFGGSHLDGLEFDLGQVGTDEIPGVVFVSPYPAGSADEAPITWADFAGDVNADGFADILIGLETADYVYPLNPTQRRIDTGECYLVYGGVSAGR